MISRQHRILSPFSKYFLRSFPASFVGSEAVDWLVNNKFALTRADAVALGASILVSFLVYRFHFIRQYAHKVQPDPPCLRRHVSLLNGALIFLSFCSLSYNNRAYLQGRKLAVPLPGTWLWTWSYCQLLISSVLWRMELFFFCQVYCLSWQTRRTRPRSRPVLLTTPFWPHATALLRYLSPYTG
jgi:hypothetical protein